MIAGPPDDQEAKPPEDPPQLDDSLFMPPSKLNPPYKPPASPTSPDLRPRGGEPAADGPKSMDGCLVAILVAVGMVLLLFGSCLLNTR